MLRDTTGGGADSATLPATVTNRLPSSLRDDDGYCEILRTLVDHGGRCSLSELTRTLVEEVSWLPGVGDDNVTNPYQRAHIALVREHLPVLSEFGVIEYDEEFGTVQLVSDKPA